MKLLFFFLSAFTLNTFIVKAQNTKEQIPAKTVQNLYHTTVGYKESVYTGQEYYKNYGKLTGHAFWQTDEYVNGSIGFAGNIYPTLPLKLDLLSNELITHGSNLGVQIKIIREKVDSFSIGTVRFWHLTPGKNKMPDAFYEILYDGKYTVLCKRNKIIKEVVSQSGVEKKIEEQNTYYIKEQNNFIEVKNRQTLYDFFKSKKNQVLDYMDKENISYRKTPEDFIVLSIKYYEQISN